jgi:hypothetical protein
MNIMIDYVVCDVLEPNLMLMNGLGFFILWPARNITARRENLSSVQEK